MIDGYEIKWDGTYLTITYKGQLIFNIKYDHSPTISEKRKLIAMASRLKDLKGIK